MIRYAVAVVLLLALSPFLGACSSTIGVPGADAAMASAAGDHQAAQRVVADLESAHALAVAQEDPIAAQCWAHLAERAKKLMAGPAIDPEAAGLFTGIQRIRGARRALTSSSEALTIACAPFKEDLRRAWTNIPAALSGLLF